MDTNFKENTKRAPNWTETEEVLLIESVKDYQATIEGKFSTSITKKAKIEAWQAVAQSLEGINGPKRSAEDCRKKFQNIKARAKSKVDQRRKTGGGKAIKQSEAEEAALGLMEGLPSLNGLQGWETAVIETEPRLCSNDEVISVTVDMTADSYGCEADVPQKSAAQQIQPTTDVALDVISTDVTPESTLKKKKKTVGIKELEKEILLLEKQNLILKNEKLLKEINLIAMKAKMLEKQLLSQ